MNRFCEAGTHCKVVPKEGKFLCKKHRDYFQSKKGRELWVQKYITERTNVDILSLGYREGSRVRRQEENIRKVTSSYVRVKEEEIRDLPATVNNVELYMLLCENNYINPFWNKRLLKLCFAEFVRRRQKTFEGFYPNIHRRLQSFFYNPHFGCVYVLSYLASEIKRCVMINKILPAHREVDFGLLLDEFFTPTDEFIKSDIERLTSILSYYSEETIQTILGFSGENEKMLYLFNAHIYPYIQPTKHLEKQRRKQQMDETKREIVEHVYHPRYVEKWLEQGGFELVEMMF